MAELQPQRFANTNANTGLSNYVRYTLSKNSRTTTLARTSTRRPLWTNEFSYRKLHSQTPDWRLAGVCFAGFHEFNEIPIRRNKSPTQLTRRGASIRCSALLLKFGGARLFEPACAQLLGTGHVQPGLRRPIDAFSITLHRYIPARPGVCRVSDKPRACGLAC
jgi:hypothetical protein